MTLTNKLQFLLRCNHVNGNVDLTFTDRDAKILHTVNFNAPDNACVTIDVPFPNTVRINLEDHQKHGFDVRLESLILAGLPLTDRILDQICSFCADDDTNSIVTRSWHRAGAVTIDFFAMNWIEYHLLYGNKITSA